MSLYAKGQLVWAKVKGYPWWPAVVAKTNQDRNGSIDKEILVNFVGDNSHAMLTHDKIADFHDKFKQHSANKNKKLQDSIKIARKILDGESTFEEEREKLIREIARSQESPEHDEVKQTSRGRPSSKKKLEALSGSAANAAVGGKDNVKEKGKESTSKSKEISQKEKEKVLLYKFKEDVLGLQMSSDTKASTTSMQDKENAPREKVSPKSQKQVKDSRLTQKQKVKEKEKEKKISKELDEFQEFQDYLPFRLTRAQSKRDPSEGHTEPSTGPTVKEQSSKGDSSKANKTSGSGQKQSKNNKETPNKPTKAKGRLLLDEDDLLDNYRNNNRRTQPLVEEKMVEEDVMSPGKLSERKYSGPKSEIEDKKEPPKPMEIPKPVEAPVRKASESEKMEVEVPKEVKTLEVRKNSDEISNKRSNSNILKDSPPIYGAQIKNKEDKPPIRVLDESDFITKKVKLGSSTRNDEEEVLDEKELGTEVYNMLMIKRFEENLRKILDKLSTKLQGTERLKEYDADMIKMLGIIEDFESRTFSGSEFVGSDLGKILKTIHFLLIKNKHKLPKTGDLVITALAKIIHKIKDKILKFCLDNSDYMEALHLPQDKAKPIAIAAIDIDFEEIRAKIEEGEDPKVETKVEEEHPAAHAHHAQKPIVHHIIEAPAPVQQPTTPVLMSYGQREVHREHVKASPVIRPSEPNEISLLLRKKICQKLAKLLQRSYNIDKDRSQKLTLHIEDKLNKFYLGNVNEYKHAIKGLHKLIKTQSLKFDDLTQILEMTIQQFRQMLREKLPEMADIYNDISPPMNTEEVEKRDLPLLNEDSTTFDFDACLKAKLDSDMALNMAKKNEDDIKPKMLVDQPNSFIQDLFQPKEEGL